MQKAPITRTDSQAMREAGEMITMRRDEARALFDAIPEVGDDGSDPFEPLALALDEAQGNAMQGDQYIIIKIEQEEP